MCHNTCIRQTHSEDDDDVDDNKIVMIITYSLSEANHLRRTVVITEEKLTFRACSQEDQDSL